MKAFFTCSFLFAIMVSLAQSVPTPDQLYGQLFQDVQMQRIFPDGKTFVDCTPKRPVKDIMYDYGMMKGPGMDLKQFVADNFDLPKAPQMNYVTQEKDVRRHITNLWSALKRDADAQVTEGSSLLPLPKAYIVPGGRFREIYYWDSYFTMLGLKESGEVQTIRNMIDNFAFLINTYGHIPNGNRSYYVSRSQPPFFALMVELLATIDGKGVYKKYYTTLEKEYRYWMRGSGQLKPGEAAFAVVRLPNGDLLNRYWDDLDQPRQESYREDIETADKQAADRLAAMRFDSEEAKQKAETEIRKTLNRHLRAGAASGWDYSTRWFADGQHITTIQTTDILPVDLNALLYQLEMTLAKAAAVAGVQGKATGYQKLAAGRAQLINKYCWNADAQFYTDYNWLQGQKLSGITAAGMYPFALLPKAYWDDKNKVAGMQLQKQLLKPGGIVTTTQHSGQQWDAPNGWAPLQWMSIWGLERMGLQLLARDVARRWITLNTDVFARTGKLMEKYNVEDTKLEAGGGEYPSQDGFGWTNGVLLALMKKYGN